MARSMGGGGRSGGIGSIGGGRSMGGGGRSVSRSFSGSGRSHVSGGSGARRVGGSNNFGGPGYNSGYNRGYNTGYSRGYRSHNVYYRGPGMPPPPRRYYGRRSSAGCGSAIAAFFIMVLIVVITFSGARNNSNTNVSGKKLNKDKYEGAVYDDRGYYLDESDPAYGGFIDSSNESTLISGMRNFYNRTGVFPFLYIVETTGGINAKEFGEAAYEELFTDRGGKPVEGNLLILFVASDQGGEGDYYLIGGLNIGATIDSSALDEIHNQINGRWDSGDLANIIGNGLDAASKNIMAKSNGTKIAIALIIALAVIVVILILFKWWKAKKAQQNKEQEDLEKVLSTPLETFGDPMSELTQKYDDNQQ